MNRPGAAIDRRGLLGWAAGMSRRDADDNARGRKRKSVVSVGGGRGLDADCECRALPGLGGRATAGNNG